MKCPFCKKELSRGELKKYSNTADHVFDPNGDYDRPERITFVCDCEIANGFFWDGAGGLYIGDGDYKKLISWRGGKNNPAFAIGSWEERQHNKNEFSHFIYNLLIFSRGNKRFFLSYKISDFLYSWFVPQVNIIFE